MQASEGRLVTEQVLINTTKNQIWVVSIGRLAISGQCLFEDSRLYLTRLMYDYATKVWGGDLVCDKVPSLGLGG